LAIKSIITLEAQSEWGILLATPGNKSSADSHTCMPRSSLDKGSSKDRLHLGGGYIYRQTTVVREEADWRLFLTAFHYPHPDQRSTFPATKAAAVGDGGDGGGAPLLLSRSSAPNPLTLLLGCKQELAST